MVANKKKILFFIAGAVPTKEESEAADKLGTHMFRNVRGVYDGESLEPCDAVAGCAPESYVKKYGKPVTGKAEATPVALADTEKHTPLAFTPNTKPLAAK